MLQNQQMIGALFESHLVLFASGFCVSAMQFNFSQHGPAPRASLRQGAAVVASLQSFLQHFSSFVQIAAQLCGVREPRPSRQSSPNAFQPTIVCGCGIEITSFKGAVSGDSKQLSVFGIFCETLFREVPSPLEMVPG